MALDRNYPHLVVEVPPTAEEYKSTPGFDDSELPPEPDVAGRVQRLRDELSSAMAESRRRRQNEAAQGEETAHGSYVTVEGEPGLELDLDKLESSSKGKIEVLTVNSDADATGKEIQRAAVFVPDDKADVYSKKLDTYAKAPEAGESRKQRQFAERIGHFHLLPLADLWSDSSAAFPSADETVWFEVWLRRDQEGKSDQDSVDLSVAPLEVRRFRAFAASAGLPTSGNHFTFHDKSVLLVQATPTQLAKALVKIDYMAELRLYREASVPKAAYGLTKAESVIDGLAGRVEYPPENAPAVTIFDTGVNRGHPLLERLVSTEDVHTWRPEWGNNDDRSPNGHGTPMAGLAIYGDFNHRLREDGPISLTHLGESVKILPPDNSDPNAKDVYGAIMAGAVAQVEQRNPNRTRCFCLAVTIVEGGEQGLPSLWSAAIDALAIGEPFDEADERITYFRSGNEGARLFLVSAGNVREFTADYRRENDRKQIEDPAQSWNVLTVGAYTNKCFTTEDNNKDVLPLAKPGELSPFSRTSIDFGRQTWPIKPEVVFEGGNAALEETGEVVDQAEDLSLLSTRAQFRPTPLVAFNMTSAATALCARLVGRLQAEFPDLRAETIRALVVHSARYTKEMLESLKDEGNGGSSKGDRVQLARRCGYGVPDFDRAAKSARDALTLVTEQRIRPFAKGQRPEIHLHKLPWPIESLRALEGKEVRLRVTLSYFVEPNPSRIGRQGKFRYRSHALRFKVIGSTEDLDDFSKRLNAANRPLVQRGSRRVPAPAGPAPKDDESWWLGSDAHGLGSLHSDVWTGTAQQLSEKRYIAVRPAAGWWNDTNHKCDEGFRVPYSLVVSIETDEEIGELDLFAEAAANLSELRAAAEAASIAETAVEISTEGDPELD